MPEVDKTATVYQSPSRSKRPLVSLSADSDDEELSFNVDGSDATDGHGIKHTRRVVEDE